MMEASTVTKNSMGTSPRSEYHARFPMSPRPQLQFETQSGHVRGRVLSLMEKQRAVILALTLERWVLCTAI